MHLSMHSVLAHHDISVCDEEALFALTQTPDSMDQKILRQVAEFIQAAQK